MLNEVSPDLILQSKVVDLWQFLQEIRGAGVIMDAVKFKLITRIFAVVKRGMPFVKMRQAGYTH